MQHFVLEVLHVAGSESIVQVGAIVAHVVGMVIGVVLRVSHEWEYAERMPGNLIVAMAIVSIAYSPQCPALYR